MNGDGTRPWAVALSLLLHVGVIALLWWGAREAALKQPQPEEPLALELISGGGSVTAPAPEPVSKPVPVEEPPPVVQPPAEVNLGKPEAKKPEPKKEKPPLKLAEAKPEPKPKEKPKTPEKPAPAKKPTVDNPTKAKRKSSDVNDLLADLPPDLPPGPKQGKDKVSQGGAKAGIEGSSKGTSLVATWRAKAIAKIKSNVRIPDSVTGNPLVIVKVRVLASLDIGSVTIVQPSGNEAWDEAVRAAVNETHSVPPLMTGVTIDDVRDLVLRFRPRDQ
jgi:outer membrane biosynthesis protein TonB